MGLVEPGMRSAVGRRAAPKEAAVITRTDVLRMAYLAR